MADRHGLVTEVPSRLRCVGGRNRSRHRRNGCREVFYWPIDLDPPQACSRCGGRLERVRSAGFDLVTVWTEFLCRLGDNLGGWDWFVTLTWSDEVHPEAAWKSLRRWLVAINRLAKRRIRDPEHTGVPGICGIEWQKRGVLHMHLLLAKVAELRRLSAMDIWEKQGPPEGIARVKPAEQERCVQLAHYVAKYVGKAPGNLTFVGDIRRAVPDAEFRLVADFVSSRTVKDLASSRCSPAAASEWQEQHRRASEIGAPRIVALPWSGLQGDALAGKKSGKRGPCRRDLTRWRQRNQIRSPDDRPRPTKILRCNHG